MIVCCRADAELCRKHLTVVVRALMSNFLCEKQEVLTVAYDSLQVHTLHLFLDGLLTDLPLSQRLFEACIDSVLIEATVAMLPSRKTPLPLENVIAVVEGGLRFPYRAAWNHILRLAGVLITVRMADSLLLLALFCCFGLHCSLSPSLRCPHACVENRKEAA